MCNALTKSKVLRFPWESASQRSLHLCMVFRAAWATWSKLCRIKEFQGTGSSDQVHSCLSRENAVWESTGFKQDPISSFLSFLPLYNRIIKIIEKHTRFKKKSKNPKRPGSSAMLLTAGIQSAKIGYPDISECWSIPIVDKSYGYLRHDAVLPILAAACLMHENLHGFDPRFLHFGLEAHYKSSLKRGRLGNR